MPHVFERTPFGQIDGGVLPVVEEALLPPHVAHRRLGHHDPLQSGRDLGAGLDGGPDAGHAHEIAQGDDTDGRVPVDHRQVPVVMRRQAGPGRVDPLVGAEHVGVGGHPERDHLVLGLGGRSGGAQEVALGQDADHLPLFGHDDRSDVGLGHDACGHGEGIGAGARDGG